MKILLAVDGSPSSDAAVDEVARQKWDADCEVRIVSVVETPLAFATQLTVAPATYYEELVTVESAKARDTLERACRYRRAAGKLRRLVSSSLMRRLIMISTRLLTRLSEACANKSSLKSAT